MDKTLLIKEFIDAENPHILLARPRLFGKSLNMNMMRRFFEKKLLPNGTLSAENAINRILFLGGELDSVRLYPLKISVYSSITTKHQGQYPTIFFSANHLKGVDFQDTVAKLKHRVRGMFAEHLYLHRSNLTKQDRARFLRYVHGNMTLCDIKLSIQFLSKLLHDYHSEKVYVFVDDYDSLIRDVYLRTQDHEPFRKAADLLVHMYGNAFADNDLYVKRSFLTGVLPLALAPLADRLTTYTIFEMKFSEYYGFNRREVGKLIKNIRPKVSYRKLSKWYKGYSSADTFTFLYNPKSVLSFLGEMGDCNGYWARLGDLSYLEREFSTDQVQNDLHSLIREKPIIREVNKKIALKELRNKETLFYTLLLFEGYLNPDMSTINWTDVGKKFKCVLTVPNTEIMQDLQRYYQM